MKVILSRKFLKSFVKKTVVLYTDGACSGNPGPGGWAAILIWGEHRKEISGFEPVTTNNRMEMMGVISGLEMLKESCHVKIHSDSSYVINAFNQNWIENWQRNGWKTASKKPVENQDLWNRMLSALNPHDVDWIKVKGHSNNELNNRADELAVGAIKKNAK